LKDFFTNYKNNENKLTIVDGFGDYDEAIRVIEESKCVFSDRKFVDKK
jgi:inorganic pyrophosphatase